MFEDILTTPDDNTDKNTIKAPIALVQCPVSYKCTETCSHRDLHEPKKEGGSIYCTQKPCENAKNQGWGTVTCIP